MSKEGAEYRPWTHPNAPYNVRTFPDRLELPLRWARGRMIFVNSRSDLFHEEIPPAFRARMFEVMREASRHTFQVLTKRPENILGMLPPDWGMGYPNIWIGTSVEDQRAADARIPLLEPVPARVRFLSVEPLLGPVDLGDWPSVTEEPPFGWVIVGGESGPHARPMDLDWARAIRDWCAEYEVPFFYKQEGGRVGKRSHEEAILDGRTWKEMPRV